MPEHGGLKMSSKQDCSQTETHRRTFIKAAGGSALGICLAAQQAPAARVLGANDTIRMGIIGNGSRGSHHMRMFGKEKNVKIVAVADVDRSHRERAVSIVENVNGTKPDAYDDFRKIIDRNDIDVVSVATPGHWHAIPTIMACDAGKDVYVEKPIGHNIREGRLMADAAKRNDRVVANGIQQRSGPHFIEAIQRIHAGELGKISLVRVWNAWWTNEMGGSGPQGMGKLPDCDPPEGVDYDFWLGPAPKRSFNPHRFHFFYYFYWDYSGGMISAWGVHLFDVVMWAMGYNIQDVITTGGHFVFDDDRETPDTAQTIFTCPDYLITYEMRHGNGERIQGDMDHGIEFLGTEGTLEINRARYVLKIRGEQPVEVKSQGLDEFHFSNFIESVRLRKQPNVNAETGHRAAIYGHLANISYRVGRRIVWDAENETIPGDREAKSLLRRKYRKPWVL